MTATADLRLRLDDFIIEMMRTRQERLTLTLLERMLSQLAFREEDLQDHIRFSSRGYTRNLICRTPRFELLLIGWKPGDFTPIHDHAGSLNLVRVHRGILSSREFEVVSSGRPLRTAIRLKSERDLGSGEIASVTEVGIHQLANTSRRNLLTIHLYSPPLREMTVYDPRTGKARQRQLPSLLRNPF
jgi:cysteine dioxygenase